MSLGNDVVDLGDPETRSATLHPRFDERVFCPGERATLEASDEPHVTRWTLWAAKESGYKAGKRLDPELVFSPREFQVELTSSGSRSLSVSSGRVVHRSSVFDVEIHLDGASVHAVATSRDAARGQQLSRVAQAARDPSAPNPSAAVRRLAIDGVGSALGLDSDDMCIVGLPPLVLHRGRALEATLSLSHHGRFVAFACALRK